jgi:hypothetical protein
VLLNLGKKRTKRCFGRAKDYALLQIPPVCFIAIVVVRYLFFPLEYPQIKYVNTNPVIIDLETLNLPSSKKSDIVNVKERIKINSINGLRFI